MSAPRTQTETQTEAAPQLAAESSTVMSATGTQPETQVEKPPPESTLASATRTQGCTQEEFVSATETQPCTIYKHKHSLSTDEYQKINKGGTGENKDSVKSSKKNRGRGAGEFTERSPVVAALGSGRDKTKRRNKPRYDLAFISDPLWEELIRTWLEYKVSRREDYKSDLSVKKFHTMLRNLSRGDPALAARIIDKSIANNWAGVFELTDSAVATSEGESTNPLFRGGRSHKPATGQRIGQIKQPDDEQRRENLLRKFGGKDKDSEN